MTEHVFPGRGGHTTFDDATWFHPDPRVEPTDALPERRVDVVIIGAGIAGLLTAHHLADDGARVAVIEAARLASRTTGHSTAKITALHGLAYQRISRGRGSDAACIYAEANRRAVDRLRTLITEADIDCALTTAVAYTCSRTDAKAAEVEAEAQAASDAGLPVYTTSETDLPWPIHSAVALGAQAHFDPVAFCAGLAVQLRARGVLIAEGHRATAIEEGPTRCVVRVGERRLVADHVVQTTHLPIVDPAFLAARVRAERSYALAGPTTQMPHAPHGMYLSVDEGWSVRPRASVDGPWLVVGGEDHSMLSHVTSSQHYKSLRGWAHRELCVEPLHEWSAFDYVTSDGIPFIGRLAPRSSRRWVATGFAKWGMSTSAVAATILADGIAGRDNEHADLFDASRIVPTLSRQLVRTNAQVAGHFVGARLRAKPSDKAAPGTGTVAREGRNLVARSVRSDGRTVDLSAVCTHLGCTVEFNDGEQTWDCPCHGSRFDLDGNVLDGPATAPLASLSEHGDTD